MVEDFAETAKKTLELNRVLIQPLEIPISFAFLTATDEAVMRMRKAKINPIVAIEHPSRKLMELLDLRKSPGSAGVS